MHYARPRASSVTVFFTKEKGDVTMLQNIDMLRKLSKDDYKATMSSLGLRLSEAQRSCKDEKISVMVVFEGWSAAGKGSRISSLISWLDPRGYEVFTIQKPSEDERLRPYMWRFWRRTPAAGRIHVFDRSWYHVLIRGHDKGDAPQADPIRDVMSFEKQLADSGVIIIKLFLHVSRKEQKKRLKALAKNPDTKWRVKEADLEQNRNYGKQMERFDRILEKTDHSHAKWTVIEADDRRFADVKVYQTVVDAMEEAARNVRTRREQGTSYHDATASLPTDARSSVLSSVDPNRDIDNDEFRVRLKKAQEDLSRLHNAMYLHRVPAAVLFEGWDAAGKGGAIKRLVAPLDPRGYKVVPSGAPNDIERAHHYLWRYWNEVPKAGHMTVFDRSWYGRVMVERIEGFCSQDEWRRAFREINDFEHQLTDSGIVLMKFWLHINPDEQLRRFEHRVHTPEKQWKITDEDWRNRDKWDQYLEAVDEMLFRTSTAYAPWTIVEADHKPFARLKVAETVRDQLEKRLK